MANLLTAGYLRHADLTRYESGYTEQSLRQLLESAGLVQVECFEERPAPGGLKSVLAGAFRGAARFAQRMIYKGDQVPVPHVLTPGLCATAVRPPEERERRSASPGTPPRPVPLNVPDWAIHNVGREWATLLADTHDFTLMQFGRHEHEDPGAWDHVVWGYSTLRYSGRMLVESLGRRPRAWLRWQRSASSRLVAVVQDPSEVFPEVPDWKRAEPHRTHLRKFRRLAVTSNEMQEALAALGYDAVKVSTRSLLPARDPAGIGIEGVRAFTRALDYPRKNLPLFHALRRRLGGSLERCDAIVGGTVLPQAEYVGLVDAYNCYVCTSWQEGGPLPLMDALRRGCVALTMRVGQTDELIEDGVNGFFCDGEDEFVRRLRQLDEAPGLLREMRLNALARAAVRDDQLVRAQLREFLP